MMAEEQDHEGLVGGSGGEGDIVGDYSHRGSHMSPVLHGVENCDICLQNIFPLFLLFHNIPRSKTSLE